MDQPFLYAHSARRIKPAIGAAVILATLAGLITWALSRPDATSFYMTVSELHDGGPSASAVRVNGNVVPGSLSRRGINTRFQITDGGDRVTVVTSQPLPDAFSTGYRNDPSDVEVVAQGRYDGRRMQATEVLAKCPSKFKAKA